MKREMGEIMRNRYRLYVDIFCHIWTYVVYHGVSIPRTTTQNHTKHNSVNALTSLSTSAPRAKRGVIHSQICLRYYRKRMKKEYIINNVNVSMNK